MWEINPDGAFRPELFPPSIQVSTNLIRNTNRGALTADAELVHRGKTTMVADVRVTDDRSRLIAKATVTMLIPRPPAR
jgi:1,4-dihydroxy-2-naphthoyl-CoA hydrolase